MFCRALANITLQGTIEAIHRRRTRDQPSVRRHRSRSGNQSVHPGRGWSRHLIMRLPDIRDVSRCPSVAGAKIRAVPLPVLRQSAIWKS